MNIDAKVSASIDAGLSFLIEIGLSSDKCLHQIVWSTPMHHLGVPPRALRGVGCYSVVKDARPEPQGSTLVRKGLGLRPCG